MPVLGHGVFIELSDIPSEITLERIDVISKYLIQVYYPKERNNELTPGDLRMKHFSGHQIQTSKPDPFKRCINTPHKTCNFSSCLALERMPPESSISTSDEVRMEGDR